MNTIAFGLRSIISVVVCAFALSSSASAIEPDAPSQILTENEARLIGLSLRLGKMIPNAPQRVQQDYRDLASFYTSKHGRLLWTSEGRINDRAEKLFSECTKADQWGLRAKEFRLSDLTRMASHGALTPSELLDFEIRTSLTLLKYARHARGGRMELNRLSLDFDRKPPLLKRATVLISAADTSDVSGFVQGPHPKHEQFHLLRQAYLEALKDERSGRATTVVTPKRKNKRRASQPLSERLLINMEMWRWMPETLGLRHVWANIPEYRVRVVNGDRVVHSERMIVGKTKHKTPIF